MADIIGEVFCAIIVLIGYGLAWICETIAAACFMALYYIAEGESIAHRFIKRVMEDLCK